MEYRKLYEVAETKFCANSPGRVKTQNISTFWTAPSNFLKNNTVSNTFTQSNCVGDDCFIIKTGDIIIKRIEPTFVNYIDTFPHGIYAGNNLIIVTARQNIYPKYLAMILNEIIATATSVSSYGAVMKSIGRSELDNLKIPLLDYTKQILLGNLWYENIELEKLKVRLAEREQIKNSILIKQYIKSCGGNNNG
ncbi:MAG: hypothetical protein J1E81_09985 [Eubacterium sp.]|nr:hypothetical protein [Eubacterium sp.]